jgi:hypothetical protein
VAKGTGLRSASQNSDAWETVDTFLSLPEAYAARAALEAYGFETRLLDEASAAYVGGGPLSVLGLRLQTRADRRNDAIALLAELIAANEDDPT